MNILGGNKFSQIPEWVIDADISDGAFRLYAVLLRYADQKTGLCHPSRSTLAERIRKTPKSITRYSKELADIGAIEITVRKNKQSNIYRVFRKQPVQPNGTPVSSREVSTGHASPHQRDTDVQLLGTPVSPKRYPRNDTHLTNSDPADAGPRTDPEKDHTVQGELIPSEDEPKPPAKQKTPEQEAAEYAYDQTGKAFNFIAVRQILKWAIHERGATPQQAAQSAIDLYQAGKPIIKQTVGQYLDGHLPISRQNRSDSWADLGGQLQNYAEQKGWPA